MLGTYFARFTDLHEYGKDCLEAGFFDKYGEKLDSLCTQKYREPASLKTVTQSELDKL